MSDHEDATDNSGYSTPVPELDDHRHNHAASMSRSEDRPRRGTFDSLYGAINQGPDTDELLRSIRVRDFEEEAVVVDEDAAEASPGDQRRGRRPTVESVMEGRAVSPPNSVKAFAAARRQERDLSFSDPKADRKPESEYDAHRLYRTASNGSRKTYRSRHPTLPDDAASLTTNKSAEEDVCFPVQDERAGDSLYIDFDYLENFIQAEKDAREQANRPATAQSFRDLRNELGTPGRRSTQVATLDGDIFELPSDSEAVQEKQDEVVEVRPKTALPPVADPSRISFFSSAWESTIHSADLDGLVLPGEDIRGLFTLPRGDADGVWWLNMNNPSEEEVRAVCRAFGIHPLTIEDITTQESREKIELFPSYYFACFRSFYVDKDPETQEKEFTPFNIYVVVFREGTLSFSYANNSHAARVRKRITMLKDYVSLSSDWICYALM